MLKSLLSRRAEREFLRVIGNANSAVSRLAEPLVAPLLTGGAMHGSNRFVNPLNGAVAPRSGGGVVFLPFDIAFGAKQKSGDGSEAAGPIRVGVNRRVVFEILTVPAGCHVNFMDRLPDMACRLIQIVSDVAELGPVHQAFGAAQVGAGMQVCRMPSGHIAESGGSSNKKCNGKS